MIFFPLFQIFCQSKKQSPIFLIFVSPLYLCFYQKHFFLTPHFIKHFTNNKNIKANIWCASYICPGAFHSFHIKYHQFKLMLSHCFKYSFANSMSLRLFLGIIPGKKSSQFDKSMNTTLGRLRSSCHKSKYRKVFDGKFWIRLFVVVAVVIYSPQDRNTKSFIMFTNA